ncbi:MAG: hypothetical protein ACRCWQ_01970 [Bacilli bacterium]
MKRLTVNDIIATIDKCNCECHQEGVHVSHFMDCCEFTYVKRSEAQRFLESVQKDLKN